jgi:hypothetical protein
MAVDDSFPNATERLHEKLSTDGFLLCIHPERAGKYMKNIE